MAVFTGWMVNGKLQKEPPEEFVQKLRAVFGEVYGIKFTPKKDGNLATVKADKE